MAAGRPWAGGVCASGDPRDSAAAGRAGAARLRICVGQALAGAGAGVVAPASAEERLSLPRFAFELSVA